MKVYKKRLVNLHVDTVCDVTNKPACASLKLSFGYGSIHDGTVLSMDLDNETSHQLLKKLERLYGKEKIKSLLKDYFE